MGKTDISGLGLLEAHLGLDWAAESQDLTSPSIAPPHLDSILILPNAPPPLHRAL